ncbi:MAG: 2-C-methyl-D-erythritol 2,4-cyclodiphosphate synthase, partial [Candidatus Marinimicrobia bacterium]|nr:2-C-methyl-D-erythritol 2,4-cyclodiphosphate synthase [Candidatus Neomarinimicrobiota bacterium]
THFPSTDEHWHGADSTVFLKHAKDLLKDKGADINHIDCTVVLQEPQLADYILPMRQAIVAELGVDLSCVSIKATTTDYLGFTGRKEGLVTVAIATVDVPD